MALFAGTSGECSVTEVKGDVKDPDSVLVIRTNGDMFAKAPELLPNWWGPGAFPLDLSYF